MIQLSQRAQTLKPSPTLGLNAKARELAASGVDVVSLTLGEPDWGTYEIPSKAGIEAINKGITKYTPANGVLELRNAIAEKTKEDIGLPYSAKEVAVGAGAKFVLFSALQVLLSPGDEVIIGAPYWVSYPTMVELADGVPHIVQCGEKENFKITPALLEKAINPKTKALLFCSPNNPTGIFYTETELKALADVLRRHPQVVIISDDIYNRLVFNGHRVAPHILHVAPDLKERSILINGASKTYSMTGWRVGWAAGPAHVIEAMSNYASQTTGSTSSISQHATLAAIKGCEADLSSTLEVLKERCAIGCKVFSELPLIKLIKPDGAFYFWVDIKACLGKKFGDVLIENDKDFCRILLEKYYLVVVPGSESGTEGYLRMSFATKVENLHKAADRMNDFISKLI